MSTDTKNPDRCPFCGSEKTKLETPFCDAMGQKIYDACCSAQRNNQRYVKNRFIKGDAPKLKDTYKI